MSYSYKQWSADQTADNVIHASDLERWQDGITDAGGTWEGSWTDEKDTLTADQLNALETEIASLYGTGFTAKTWEDGQVPGVDEWNRIEDALNTILNRTAFAIYCETDNSLTFYVDTEVPSVGDTYEGKVVAAVFANVDSARYSTTNLPPWNAYADSLKTITIDSSFAVAKLTYLAYWFYSDGMSATFTGLNYMDVSSVTNLGYMFYNCTGLTSVDALAGWDVSNVTGFSYLFYNCTGLTDVNGLADWNTSSGTTMVYMLRGCTNLTDVSGLANWDVSNVSSLAYLFYNCANLTAVDISKWNTVKVSGMGSMFRNCSQLTTIYSDDSVFVTTSVTSDDNMFISCSRLVGGNGTTYSSSKVDSSMAHIDTEDNPGYFTAKG